MATEGSRSDCSHHTFFEFPAAPDKSLLEQCGNHLGLAKCSSQLFDVLETKICSNLPSRHIQRRKISPSLT